MGDRNSNGYWKILNMDGGENESEEIQAEQLLQLRAGSRTVDALSFVGQHELVTYSNETSSVMILCPQ